MEPDEPRRGSIVFGFKTGFALWLAPPEPNGMEPDEPRRGSIVFGFKTGFALWLAPPTLIKIFVCYFLGS